ncbi:MAG: glycosyltransferase family 2 protein [Phototrophicales bacterium]|nr:MAG: glycosyltransferase family 2 protein [Phototrophicales bacterium]
MITASLVEQQQMEAVQQVDHPKVSIITVGYNSLEDLKRCLPSFMAQQYPNFEIVVVDNASKDGTASYLSAHFPSVRLYRAERNLGFSGGNNWAASEAEGEYLAFINPDTTVKPDCLYWLVETLQDRSVGIATPKILMMSQPDRINTCGNDVHYTGYGYLRGWSQSADSMNTPERVFSVSGAAFLIRKDLFLQLGGFDENFAPAYVEDTDLSWRAMMCGYSAVYVPSSVVYHDYTMGFGPQKYHWLERNRYQMILKNYDWRTFALLLPAILLSEVVAWGYATMRGTAHMRAKLKSYGWLVRNLGAILQARQRVQSLRRVKDREILRRAAFRLAYDQANDGLISKVAKCTFDPLFFAIRAVCLLIVRW